MAMRYAKASSVQKAKNRIKVLEDASGVAAHASTHASGASDPINSYYAVTAHGAAHGPTGTAALSSYYAATAHGSDHAPGGTAGLESYFAVTAHGAAHAATGSAALSSYYAPTAHGVEHGPSGTAALNAFYSTTAHTHAGGSGATLITGIRSASSPTTTSTSYVDIDATNLKKTFTASGNPVIMLARYTLLHDTASGVIYMQLQDGGASVCQAQTRTQVSDIVNGSLAWMVALSAASHTIGLQWKTDAGTATMVTDGNNDAVLLIADGV